MSAAVVTGLEQCFLLMLTPYRRCVGCVGREMRCQRQQRTWVLCCGHWACGAGFW